MKLAIFSNGHRDEYKGKRDVTAAWMIITPTGKIVSGHSLDIARAQKTAASACGEHCPNYEMKPWRGIVTPDFIRRAHKVAVEAGFKDYKAMNADRKAKRDAWLAGCKIEVVAL